MITEKQFESQVKDLTKIYGWAYYHPFLSKWSERGFPDIVLCRPPRLIFAELKSEKGKLTKPQAQWLWMLRKCAETYIWRPRHLEKIANILKGYSQSVMGLEG